jgi:hypothetical protein
LDYARRLVLRLFRINLEITKILAIFPSGNYN